jgi:hypothetical protein
MANQRPNRWGLESTSGMENPLWSQVLRVGKASQSCEKSPGCVDPVSKAASLAGRAKVLAID